MTTATRGVTIRDFFIFQLKLVLDGLKDVAVFHLSIVALVVDMISGGGSRPRLFYSLMRITERLDLWLNVYGAAEHADAAEDGLFGASRAGSDTLLGKLEQITRGGDTPRSRRR